MTYCNRITVPAYPGTGAGSQIAPAQDDAPPNCINCGAPDEPMRLTCSYCLTPCRNIMRRPDGLVALR